MINTTIRNEYNPDFVSPPGDSLAEMLESRGMSQAELATRMGRPKKTINEIIHGKAAITPETAIQLEKVLQVPARFWNNREKLYRESIAQQREQENLLEDLNWLKSLPIAKMVEEGWIKKGDDPIEQLSAVLKFFGVVGREQWKQIWTAPLVAYRESKAFTSQLESLSVWLRKGELEAQRIECLPYNKSRFRQILVTIRALTKEPDPAIFIPELTALCARAGVAVAFIPEIPGVKACGATFWASSSKAVIQLSLRYRTNDHLWFTFFHEAGHILFHKNCFIIEGIDGQDDLESEANEFSRDFLIDKKEYQGFVTTHRRFSKVLVSEFAQNVDIAPGIVVGRLQYDKYVPFTHLNGLKISYTWG